VNRLHIVEEVQLESECEASMQHSDTQRDKEAVLQVGSKLTDEVAHKERLREKKKRKR
jgi:hypothetical protein